MQSISVVFPAHNEEANIGSMLETALQVLTPITPDLEVIVVADGSRDRTPDIVREFAAKHPNVRLIVHPKNLGYGAALFSGFTAARKEWVFMTDSDRQFDLNEVHKLLPYTDRADLVIGYRAPRRDSFLRRLYGWGWNSLIAILFGYTAHDVDCAFKLFKREILDHITIQSRGAMFSAEFLVRAKRAGYKSAQVPVTHLPRLAGKPSGARLDVITRAFSELMRVRVALWRER